LHPSAESISAPLLRAAGLDWPEPRHGSRFIDLGPTLEAAACGKGIALGPPSLAAAWLRSDSLVRPFSLTVTAQTPYVLHVHGDMRRFQGLCRLADRLLQRCRKRSRPQRRLIASASRR